MLGDIVQHVKEVVTADDRPSALRKINRAAKEIYDSADLPGSLFENTFDVSLENHLITLPWYATQVRGVRRSEFRGKISLIDQRPRYHSRPWQQPYYTWSLLAETPLQQHQTETGRLVVTLLGEEDTSVSVTITGQTTTSTTHREVLSFEPGETSKTTAAQFTQAQPVGIKSITKSRLTTYDIRITQESDERVLAVVPNVLYRAANQLIQIRDDNGASYSDTTECVDVLFKWPYIELVEDSDEFCGSDKWDDAIAWKVKENYYSTDPTKVDLLAASAAKCAVMLKRIATNTESPTDKVAETMIDACELAPLRGRARRMTYGYPR